MLKKLERSKSHVTPSPRNASRSNDAPNSKTKHQIAAARLKNVSPKIKKRFMLSNVLNAELSVAIDSNKKDVKSL